ncbi:MAG TPA: flagellar basal-body MS-ring/collar protein FliF [Acidimicrobiales bacterium]|nr:flagellar basal-body MS-ring/collar protein FliF [Acidimicrobiales bacterium]
MALVPSNELTRVRETARRFASGFTPGQKAVTVAAVLAVVVGIVGFMAFSGRPTYAPLFTNVQPSDAANITAHLSTDHVPFELADGGSTIMVPENDVASERLSLAQAGLPATSTVGLSLLDKEGITASSITQQADYLQAIQGELEQTIDAISGVSSSQVNVALPANDDFALSQQNPTGASVMVTMQPGQTLSNQEVESIVHLVGSSVPGLDADNVTVADSNGDLLAGPGVAAGGAGSDNQTQAYDAAVTQKVQSYLSAVLGENNAAVQVNATLNYDQVQTTTQSLVPGKNGQQQSFCTQTSQANTTFSGAGSPPGGEAGSVTIPVSANGNSTYSQTQNSQTCETSQETQTVNQAPGTVKTQSVAVLVNSKALPKGVSLDSLRQGVSAAAGIQASRGDTLAFSSMPFNAVAAKQAAQAAAAATTAAKKQSLQGLIRTAVVVIVLGVVLFLLWRSARRARSTVTAQPVLTESLTAALPFTREEPTGQLPTFARADVSASVEAQDVNRFIDSQPDEVANMLRTWLGDKHGAVTQ